MAAHLSAEGCDFCLLLVIIVLQCVVGTFQILSVVLSALFAYLSVNRRRTTPSNGLVTSEIKMDAVRPNWAASVHTLPVDT